MSRGTVVFRGPQDHIKMVFQICDCYRGGVNLRQNQHDMVLELFTHLPNIVLERHELVDQTYYASLKQ